MLGPTALTDQRFAPAAWGSQLLPARWTSPPYNPRVLHSRTCRLHITTRGIGVRATLSTWRVPRLGLGHCCPTPCRSPSRLRVSRGRRCYPTSLPSPPVLSWTGQGRHPPTRSSSTNRGVSRGQGRKPLSLPCPSTGYGVSRGQGPKPLSLPCPSITTTSPTPETMGLRATETAANYLSVGLPSTACCAQDGP